MTLYDKIPEILKGKPNWVVWGIPGEAQKAPYNPESLLRLQTSPAKSGIPETWGRFESAVKCVSMGLAQGIGYEFDGSSIFGVDLDGVIGENDVTSEAREIVERLDSFTEISPSGTGLHIFVTADNVNITRHRRKGCFIEIYNKARYFTMTGNIYGGFDRIDGRAAELQQIHDTFLQPKTIIREDINSNPPTGYSQLSHVNWLSRGLEKDPVLRDCWNGGRRCGLY
jgi:putative DNA primase/helicase